jgi:hypothetical protein
VRPEPRTGRELCETGAQLGNLLAEDDVASPATEPWFDDHGWGDGDSSGGRGDVDGGRMRDAGRGKGSRRRQLVVGGDERSRSVEDANARTFESSELPEAGLDPVELVGDVQAADGNVALAQFPESVNRREHLHPGTGCERDIRRRSPVGDEGDGHRTQIVR